MTDSDSARHRDGATGPGHRGRHSAVTGQWARAGRPWPCRASGTLALPLRLAVAAIAAAAHALALACCQWPQARACTGTQAGTGSDGPSGGPAMPLPA